MSNSFLGENPHGPDMPLGLGMELMQYPDAMAKFSGLADSEKAQIINYVQSSTSGDDAKSRITQTVESFKV